MYKIQIISTLIFTLTKFELSAQIYPSNFLWNGCGYVYNGYKSDDTVKCYETSYKLVFEDNFDSTVLNRSNWQPHYPWGRSLHSPFTGTGWERQFYTDDNVTVNDGYLRLTTRVDPGNRSPDVGVDDVFFNYTSGMVFSTMNFTKGKFEIRCKVPKINGMFPAFWLFGYCAQEIDIFEFTNESETSDATIDAGHVIMTYHKEYDCSDHEKGLCNNGFSKNFGKDLSADFHIYSVEWNEFKIIWKMDGEIAREVYRLWTISAPSPNGSLYGYAFPVKRCVELKPSGLYSIFEPFPTLDHRMHLIINNAVLKERASESDALPQEFLIDYVRAYEEIEGELIGRNTYHSSLIVYPNPSSGSFSFTNTIDGDSILKIEVLNAIGTSAEFDQSLTDNVITLKLKDEMKGVYSVKVTTGLGVYVCKVVIN